MRPVNLIPPDQRRATRGEGARTQVATRALLAVLGVALVAVTALVLVSNQVKEKQDELAAVSQKQAAAKAAGDALRPYGTFVQLQQARYNTVTALARSRFNWERVLRQLSRTVPDDVWLTEMSGTVSPSSTSAGGGAGGSPLRGGVQAPAVELKGCARSQKSAARMIVRMRNLDAVDAVVLTSSEQAQQETEAGAAGGTAGPAGGCEGKRYEIELLIAFKASPAASVAAPLPAAATAQPAAAGGTGEQPQTTTPTTTTGATP